MYLWLWLAIISGILMGFWDIFRKKGMEKTPLLDVLALYSLFCFLLVAFEFKNAMNIQISVVLFILLKSIIIYVSWIFSFIALDKMPISIFSPFKTLTPLFCIVFGIFILDERLVYLQYVGIVIMLISYYFIGKSGKSETHGFLRNTYFYLMVFGTFLNAISALFDKIVLKTVDTGQLQFWYALFMVLLYSATLIASKVKNKDKTSIKYNIYIPLMSITLILADRIYFKTLAIPEANLSIILPLRYISVMVSSILGGIIFKEKYLLRKFAFISILILGITLVFIGQ